MRKLLLSVLLVLTMLAVSFAGCSSNAPQSSGSVPQPVQPDSGSAADQDSMLYGVCLYEMSNTFTSYIRKGMESYCTDKDITLETVDAGGDMTKQVEQCQAFIQKGADALLVAPVDSGGCATIVDMCVEADIPVVFFDKKPLVEDLERYEKAYYVGLDAMQNGVMQTELIINDWTANPEWDLNGDGTLQYLMVMGSMGDEDAEMRTAANREGLAAAGVKAEELDAQLADWDTTKAKEVMDTWTVKYADSVEMVICNNDAMALGVVESLKSAGYLSGDKYLPVFGINAIPDILDMISDGTVAGTILSDPWAEARACIDIASNLAGGKDAFDGTEWYLAQDKSVLVTNLPISKTQNLDLARETYSNCL